MTTSDDDDALAQEALAIAERILDNPDDPDALAAGRAFLAEHADAVARTRQWWRAERAARPLDPVEMARIDRELANQYPDIAEYLARDREMRGAVPGVSNQIPAS